MIEPEKLAAFVLVTGVTSFVPGPSMLFVMGQAMWRGARSGVAALTGVQAGYIIWWLLAALGLGTLAAAFPTAFRLLAVAGATYLAWLGLQALRNSGDEAEDGTRPRAKLSRNALRDGIFVALGNPKALIYIVALLPPFVDTGAPVVPQLVVLAAVAMTIDVAIGALYIFVGSWLARAMARPETRAWLNRVVGAIFLTIAVAILVDLLFRANAG